MTEDEEEFAMIFNEVYPNLCRFLECMLGKRGNAQDIAQESFLRLFRKSFKNIPPSEARFWLYRVARNLALNELSKAQTRSRLFDKVAGAFRHNPPDPEQEYERDERKQMVLALLESLPEQQRAALLLREQEQMSYSEIAHVLNVSESKVKVDIFRARNALRERWNDIQIAPARR
jgi:RNA polymerase sigma-70 factor (ECF subfamily)